MTPREEEDGLHNVRQDEANWKRERFEPDPTPRLERIEVWKGGNEVDIYYPEQQPDERQLQDSDVDRAHELVAGFLRDAHRRLATVEEAAAIAWLSGVGTKGGL